MAKPVGDKTKHIQEKDNEFVPELWNTNDILNYRHDMWEVQRLSGTYGCCIGS